MNKRDPIIPLPPPKASTRVPEYRETFLTVANEMQMAVRKHDLSDRPKKFFIR